MKSYNGDAPITREMPEEFEFGIGDGEKDAREE